MIKKKKKEYNIDEIRYIYCNETPKAFLKSIEFDEKAIKEYIFSTTFVSKEECLENQVQIGLEDIPKEIRIKISVSVEEV